MISLLTIILTGDIFFNRNFLSPADARVHRIALITVKVKETTALLGAYNATVELSLGCFDIYQSVWRRRMAADIINIHCATCS